MTAPTVKLHWSGKGARMYAHVLASSGGALVQSSVSRSVLVRSFVVPSCLFLSSFFATLL